MPFFSNRSSGGTDTPGKDLPEAWAAGLSKEAFDQLYHAEHRRLWLLAAGLTGRANDADDILQEALMLAFGKREFFRSTGRTEADRPAFAAWIGRFVRNVAANYQRSRRRQAKRQAGAVDPALLGEEAGPGSDMEEAALRGEVPLGQGAFDDRVLRALNRVKPVSRACLLMNVVGGMTQAEIAVALRLRENTVASHIRRARERLRELLEPAGRETLVPGRDVGNAIGPDKLFPDGKPASRTL